MIHAVQTSENDVGIEFCALLTAPVDIHSVPGGQPRLRPYELLLGKDLLDDERLLQPQDLRSWALAESQISFGCGQIKSSK